MTTAALAEEAAQLIDPDGFTELPPFEDVAEEIQGTRVQLVAAFWELLEPARFKAYYGGRGSGKSHGMAIVLLLLAKAKPLRILCCREIQNSIKDSIKATLEEYIEKFHWGNFFVSTRDGISGANGSIFIFEGLRHNVASIKSMHGIDICFVDEADMVSTASLELLIPTIRQPGSEIWFAWNPKSPKDAVDQFFRGNDSEANSKLKIPWSPPPNSIIREVNYDQNPFFKDSPMRAEMEFVKARDPEKYAHIWLGHYQTHSESRVFHNWRIAERFADGTVEDFDEFNYPEHRQKIPGLETVDRYYYGADWGYANDPTVLVQIFLIENRLYVKTEAYKIGCEIDNTPQLFDTIPFAKSYPITADSSRPETISYMKRHGYPNIKGAMKGPGSVEDGIEFLKNYDIIVHPDCIHTIEELSLYSWATDRYTQEILPRLEDSHNHVIDALRYALEGFRRGGGGVTHTLKGHY